MSENATLYQKIARIMGRLDRMPKTGKNKHFGYKFVTDADVADAIRAELATEDIAFFASMISAHQENDHTVAEFEFTFACAETGATIVSRWFGEADDKQDKGLSKAATSAEKFFLLKTFMISTGDPEDDPDNAPPIEKRPQTPKKAVVSNDSPVPGKKGHDHGASLQGDISQSIGGGEDDPRADAYYRDQPKSDLPTIRDYWPDVAHSLLAMQVADLPDGLNIGKIIYPAAKRMGYPIEEALKQTLGLDSLKDWDGTLEQLMVCVLDHAAEFAD